MTTLPDLAEIIADTSKAIDVIDPLREVTISQAKFDQVATLCKDEFKSEEVHGVGGHTLCFRNTGEQTRYVSVQEFPLLVALANLVKALEPYREAIDRIATEMGYPSRSSGKDLFGKLPTNDVENDLTEVQLRTLLDAIDTTLPDAGDSSRMLKFLTEPKWSGMADDDGKVGRKLDRSSDWQESAVLKTGKMIAAANAGRFKLVRALAKAGIQTDDLVLGQPVPDVAAGQDEVERLTGGANILFYGAPGTGKSHDVWEMVGEGGPSFSTVFHPDMQNSDFTGTLKPGLDSGGKVTYAFNAGPFARAVASAWSNPHKRVFLVIEELNRAVAAAVFGELFQLLDRNPDGSGRYKVSFPSPEFANWFAAETGFEVENLALPSNLWILATMNSADQGVYPLDTAFRRRWKQKYLAIDYAKAPDAKIEHMTSQGAGKTDWKTFIEALNIFLVSRLDIGEDRLLGPRFVDEQDLAEGDLPGKLLIYLWDDLLRHHGRVDLFADGITTYGELDRRVNARQQIFSDTFLATLPEKGGDEAAGDDSALAGAD